MRRIIFFELLLIRNGKLDVKKRMDDGIAAISCSFDPAVVSELPADV
jgi:hypothetical protein